MDVGKASMGGRASKMFSRDSEQGKGQACCSLKNMARLGVEPRLPEYIPGALPTELPSLGKSMGWLLFCHFEFVNRLHIQQSSGMVGLLVVSQSRKAHKKEERENGAAIACL